MNYGKLKIRIIFLAIIFFGFFGLAQNSEAATFYVATNGNNNNSGTEAQPWVTIQKAADTMVAGDTVIVKEGTYYEMVTMKNSGSPGSYITYQAYPGHTVIIDGQNTRYEAIIAKSYSKVSGFILQNARYGLYAGGKNNIIIDHIEARNNWDMGIYINNSSYVEINYCYLHHNQAGFYLAGPSSHITIDHCHTEYNVGGTSGIVLYAYPDSNANTYITVSDCESNNNGRQGLWAQFTKYLLVKNNHFHDNGATGIQIETGCRYVVADNNIAEKNNNVFNGEYGIWFDETINGIISNNISRENQGGFSISQSHNIIMKNNFAYNNKAQQNQSSCTWCPASSGGLSVSAGHAEHLGAPYGATHNSIIHNVFYGNGRDNVSTWGAMRTLDNLTEIHDNYSKNNIISQNPAVVDMNWIDTDAFATNNYNLFYNARALLIKYAGTDYNFSGYKTASGWDANSISSNPFFVNPSSDFHLQVSSPAINAGDFLTKTTSAGSGISIPVTNAKYFSNGYGIIDGDLIKVGLNSPVSVVDVNYDANIITINSSISWNNGDGVSYSYSGSRPDIGAYEYQFGGDITSPAAPSGLTVQ
ncbi:MAG: right-handed parallel beta-helix repeat-containing protein [Parcubacteria group bacterium]